MLWYIVVVAAVAAATQGQIVTYDGNTFVDNNAQPVMIGQVPAQAPIVVPAPAPVPTFQPILPPPQPSVFLVNPQGRPQVDFSRGVPQGVPQGFLPPLPASCPSTHSLVHASYQGHYYHFSWCYHSAGHLFNHQQAADYCSSLNQFSHPLLHFEVVRVDDTTELSFISYLLRYYALSAVWTGDTSNTASYTVRRYINRSGTGQPGHDCLSVETAILDLNSIWFHEKSCSDAKLVICEGRHY